MIQGGSRQVAQAGSESASEAFAEGSGCSASFGSSQIGLNSSHASDILQCAGNILESIARSSSSSPERRPEAQCSLEYSRMHRRGVSRHLVLRPGLLVLLLLSMLDRNIAVAQTDGNALSRSPAAAEGLIETSRAGYRYAGRVSFVHTQQVRVPVLDISSPFEGTPSQPDHYTVLVTSSGHSYTKRLVTDINDPELASALSAVDFSAQRGSIDPHQGHHNDLELEFQSSRRMLTQTALPNNVGVASTDLGCDGCSGYDNRVQVTNTVQFPFSAVGELTGQIGTSNRGLECTGTLIGPKHVVTAAHCVYDINDSHQYVASLNFVPGQNGNSKPYGQAEWSAVRVLSQFTDQTSYTPTAMNYDFALITLKSPVPSNAGFLGMSVGQGFVTLNLTTAGYPGEKPSGTMWESLCAKVQIQYNGNQGVFSEIDQCQNQMCGNIMSHTCLSSNGQSGSSMWDSNQRIRAILTGKVSTSDNQDINVATKIDAFVYNTIAQWYNEDAKADGSNVTLPAAPSGPQPAPANTEPKTFLGIRLEWNNPIFIAIVVALGCVALAIILGLLCCISRACGRSAAPKVVYGRDVNSRAAAQRQFMANGATNGAASGSGSYPSHSVRHSQHGVVYDERRGQFVVNGRPYGAYQFDADRGYFPTRGL